MSLETIRDLIYKEENEVLLHMYRGMFMALRLGAPIDNVEFEMLQKHLTQEIPLWLIGDPELKHFEPYATYEQGRKFLTKEPTVLRFAELIHSNCANVIDRTGYNKSSGIAYIYMSGWDHIICLVRVAFHYYRIWFDFGGLPCGYYDSESGALIYGRNTYSIFPDENEFRLFVNDLIGMPECFSRDQLESS